MLTKEQRKALKPVLTVIQSAQQEGIDAANFAEQLTARVATLEAQHDQTAVEIVAKEGAHREAVQADDSQHSAKWRELQALRRTGEEQAAALAAVREQLSEAQDDSTRAQEAFHRSNREFLTALHAHLVESAELAVRQLYEDYLAPCWYVERAARAQPDRDKTWCMRWPGVKNFYVPLPRIRAFGSNGDPTPLGDKPNGAAIKIERTRFGPGIEPERAEGWVQSCIEEILAA